MVYGRPRWGGHRAALLTALVLARDEHVCYWCGGYATTADHWPVARSEGGPDTLDNLVAACGPCNFARGARLRNATRKPSRRW